MESRKIPCRIAITYMILEKNRRNKKMIFFTSEPIRDMEQSIQ